MLEEPVIDAVCELDFVWKGLLVADGDAVFNVDWELVLVILGVFVEEIVFVLERVTVLVLCFGDADVVIDGRGFLLLDALVETDPVDDGVFVLRRSVELTLIVGFALDVRIIEPVFVTDVVDVFDLDADFE